MPPHAVVRFAFLWHAVQIYDLFWGSTFCVIAPQLYVSTYKKLTRTEKLFRESLLCQSHILLHQSGCLFIFFLAGDVWTADVWILKGDFRAVLHPSLRWIWFLLFWCSWRGVSCVSIELIQINYTDVCVFFMQHEALQHCPQLFWIVTIYCPKGKLRLGNYGVHALLAVSYCGWVFSRLFPHSAVIAAVW